MKGNPECPQCGGHGVEEVLGRDNCVLEVECEWRDKKWRAHDLVAALRFHKHELTHQAADRIEQLEAALNIIASGFKGDKVLAEWEMSNIAAAAVGAK